MIALESELDGFFAVPHDDPPGWLLMLYAYVDESGQESQDNWMFIAGFLGNEEQWRQLAGKWKEALGPQRTTLHMKDLMWKKDHVRQLLERLGPIPAQCGLTPVFGGVRVSDYADLVSGTVQEKWLKGYIACLFPLVLEILRYIPSNERVEIVFEQQDRYQTAAHLALAEISKIGGSWGMNSEGQPKLANWNFVPKGRTILLQAADCFAYSLLQVWRDKNSKRAQWCMPILNSGDGEGVGKIMSREKIREVVQQTHMRLIFQQLEEISRFSARL